MATQFVETVDPSSDRTIAQFLSGLKDRTGANATPFLGDADTGKLHYYDRVNSAARELVNTDQAQTLTSKTLTAPVITNPTFAGSTPVAFTSGTTLALTQALHANRVVYVTDVAADYRLPAATGTGDVYTIVIGATQTGASTIKVNATPGTDTMLGTAVLFADGGATVVGFACIAGDDTVDLLGTGNSTGGMIGATYEFTDVAAGLWIVRLVSDAAGTEATPFSATV